MTELVKYPQNKISEHKKQLRYHMRCLLRNITEKHKIDCGFITSKYIKNWFEQNDFSCIVFFENMDDEISTKDLSALLSQLKLKSFLPHMDQIDRLCFDIELENIDVIFLPGLAFDRFGHRLGRGKGHYDRALGSLENLKNKKPILVGLAMDEQIVAELPCEKHDVVMDFLCTPGLGIYKIFRERESLTR